MADTDLGLDGFDRLARGSGGVLLAASTVRAFCAEVRSLRADNERLRAALLNVIAACGKATVAVGAKTITAACQDAAKALSHE